MPGCLSVVDEVDDVSTHVDEDKGEEDEQRHLVRLFHRLRWRAGFRHFLTVRANTPMGRPKRPTYSNPLATPLDIFAKEVPEDNVLEGGCPIINTAPNIADAVGGIGGRQLLLSKNRAKRERPDRA